MRKTSFFGWTLVLYVVMAVFVAGIVHATFIDDQDTQYGTYTVGRSYASGTYSSGKVHDPYFRSQAWNTTSLPSGILYMEFKWYADNLWQSGKRYDLNHQSYLSDEDTYSGNINQATCETQAGRYSGFTHYPDTEWAVAGIPNAP